MSEQKVFIGTSGSYFQAKINSYLQAGWKVVSVTSPNPSWGNLAEWLVVLEKKT